MKRKKPLLICDGSSAECVRFIQDHRKEMGKIKKITSFLDNRNFLLTQYIVDDNFINTVIENETGDEIWLGGLNCGYVGEGPNATAWVLELLGISRKSAQEWKRSQGLVIDFTKSEEQNEKNGRIETPFFGEHTACAFRLDVNTKSNVSQRNFFMYNPQFNNFTSLLNALHVMEPTEMEFCIGDKYTPLYEDQAIFSKKYALSEDGINLIIRGNVFNLICYINPNIIASTVNCLYSYIMGRVLFQEDHYGFYTLLRQEDFERYQKAGLLKRMFLKAPKEIRRKEILEDRILEPWKIEY